MAVAYAKFWPRCSFYLNPPPDKLNPLFERNVLLYDPVFERLGTTSIGQRLRQLEPPQRECDILLIRGRNSEVQTSIAQEMDLLARLTSAQAICTVSPEKPGAAPTARPLTGTLPREITSDLIRWMEIEAILRRTNAVFRDPHVHYLLPSQDHAAAFLRIADALHDPTEVGRLAEWCLPHMPGSTILVGDNGSLLPLLLVLSDQLRRSEGIECHVRTVSEYPTSADTIEQLLDDIVTRHPATPITFVVSANSSGRLIDRFISLAPEETKVLVLCNTQAGYRRSGVEVLHELPIERYARGSDGRCAACQDKSLVGIDPRTYERIPNFTYRTPKIDISTATRHAPFWEAVNRRSAVRLHYNLPIGENEIRHHGIYIDVAALLQDGWFRSQVLTSLGKLPVPNLLLVPGHSTSDAVIDVVLEAFPKTPTIKLQQASLPDAAIERLKGLGSEERLLIADDALVQGTTLRGLGHSVYRVLQTIEPSPTMHAFVCLARPDSDETYVATARMYRGPSGSQLSEGYRINLPSSGERHCPWCGEVSLLSRLARQLSPDHRRMANARLSMLTRYQLGPKFLWDIDELSGEETTKNSFFGTLSSRVAFAAATSAAYNVKLNLEAETARDVVAVLDLPMAIECYFDSVLLAAILRTVDRKEIFCAGQTTAIHKELARYPAVRAYPGNIGELAWAAINYKLPIGPVVEALKKLPPNPNRELLLALLEIQKPFEP